MKKNKKSLFIVLEGTDGSGKATQFRYLLRNLKKVKIKYKTLDFPQYGKPSAYFVENYLRGKYGTLKEIGPYQASLFYALDRFDVSRKIKDWLRQGYTVIANRYTISNFAYQGAKIKNNKLRLKYFHWLMNLEYNILG
ncbi:thymidylate kinase, partial [bacterium]|nr:thymidylate kinase [bacterium]